MSRTRPPVRTCGDAAPPGSPWRRRGAATVLLVLVLAACGDAQRASTLPPPRDGRSGVQLSGTVDGRQLVVARGLPVLNTGDCDVNEGPDRDVCIVTEDLDGGVVLVVFENPAVLVAGETVPVGLAPCRSARACDDVTEVALVELQLGFAPRVQATGGSVTLTAVEPSQRYAGTIRLQFPGGRLTGDFDVIPRPEELSAR